MSESIRIRTSPNGGDTYIKTQLTQDFDFIEILSLKISQEKVYQRYCSDYGVVVGRVVVNSGFGVPNAKVSIFIPIDEADKNNPEIRGLYPFETVMDKDSNGVRYNLLPKESDNVNKCYTPVGTFPSKRETLDNEIISEIYKKYYKFTSTTNEAGDFMIFGVPVGNHIVHVDADISNIGIISQRPYNLIEQGSSNKLFTSSTKFKGGTNLDSLPQIKSINVGVNVLPFWGDIDNFQIGISRVDFDLNYRINPTAIFMGSIFSDSDKFSVNKNCKPRKKMGSICETTTSAGRIDIIRKELDGSIQDYYIEGGDLIDEDGTWSFQIPMNLDYMITDEFGNLILSEDPNKGIPTRTSVRFRIGLNEAGGIGRLRTRANFLVPHNPSKFEDSDFSFDKTTKDSSFADMYWNKIYSVKSFIPRVQNSGGVDVRSTLGLKDLNNCVGLKNPFPYNRIDTNINPLFSIICVLITILATIVSAINKVFCSRFFTKLFNTHPIPLACGDVEYHPGCKNDKKSAVVDCISATMAQEMDVFELDFYNDWINGSLYAYSLKYKRKKKGNEKYCEYDCDDFPDSVDKNKCNSKLLLDSCTGYGMPPSKPGHEKSFELINLHDGFITNYNDVLYYSPIIHRGVFKLFAADIISLGAISDNDWQGIPKIQQYLLPTSFKIPPTITEAEGDEVVCGMTNTTNSSTGNGVFFSINCGGVKLDEANCSNIKKICEIGCNLPGADCNVGINDIYDTSDPVDVVNNINKYVRTMFYGLNVSGTTTFSISNSISSSAPQSGTFLNTLLNAAFGIQLNPLVNQDPLDSNNNDLLFYGLNLNGGNAGLYRDINSPGYGTSFNILNAAYNQTNGYAYDKFRGFYPQTGNSYHQPLGNSFFFYFGLNPGKTALDKMNRKYFSDCSRIISDDFIIETSVSNVSESSLNDGTITINFLGGTAPFLYTVNQTTYTYNPSNGGNNVVSNLSTGEYRIVAVDVNGNSAEKTVMVGLPASLSFYLEIIKQITSVNSNDGKVMIYSISGGKAPYTLNYINPDNVSSVIAVKQGDIINEVKGGNNTFIISDSSTPTQYYTIEVNMQTPDLLTVDTSVIDSMCGEDNFGKINIKVSGGLKPYTMKIINSSGQEINLDDENGFLAAGKYNIIVTDSSLQSITKVVEVKVASKPVAVINTIKLTNGNYRHSVSARNGYGIPPYTGIGDFEDANKTLTTTITDSTDCESDSVTG